MTGFVHSIRRGLALLLAVALLAVPMAALGSGAPGLSIALQWQDEGGQIWLTDPAQPIPYPGYENSYWLQAPQGLFFTTPTLQIQDPYQQYAAFFPDNGEGVFGVMDAGADLLTAIPSPIRAYNAQGEEVATLNLYVSTQPMPPSPFEPAPTDAPVPTEIPVYTASVTIHYVDEAGAPVAPDGVYPVTGTESVAPQQYLSPDEYQLISAPFQTVTAEAYGAVPAEITFTYQRVIQPARVTVRYLDGDGNPVLDDTATAYDPASTSSPPPRCPIIPSRAPTAIPSPWTKTGPTPPKSPSLISG